MDITQQNISDTFAKTSSQKQGIVLQPRLPTTVFTDDLPIIHSLNLGATSYNNIFSICAGIAEKYFIRIGDMMVSLIENDHYRTELNDFVRQEATHSLIHSRMNAVLEAQGLPVKPLETWVDAIFTGMFKAGGYPKLVMLAVAGEQVFGLIGEGFLKQHKTLEQFDPRVAEILLWHGYEELEHSAAIFDGLMELLNDPERAYRWRLASIPYMIFLMIIGFPVLMIVLLRHAGTRELFRYSNWRDFFSYVLGKNGILSGAGKQVLAYAKKDFHPWQYSGGKDMLQEYQRYARPEWNMPAKPVRFNPDKGRELKAAIDAKDAGFWKETAGFFIFAWHMIKASFRTICDASAYRKK